MTQQPTGDVPTDDWSPMTAPDSDLTRKYPKITRLFQSYLVDQPEEVWAEQVQLYRAQGEKRLEFKGVANELDTLSGDANECAQFLNEVLGIDQNPTDAYRTICNTYNELVVGDAVPSNARFRVRNAADWVPDINAEDDAAVINSKQLFSMQLKATVPVLPGRWGTIPIITYLTSFFVLLAIGVLITLLLPYPAISQIGSLLILLGLIGLMVSALLMTSFRRLLLHGDGEDDEDSDGQDDGAKKQPGFFRRMFRKAKA